jgi:phosphoribosylformimino-5-aminoimidazole carboxamide ribotide isomerase
VILFPAIDLKDGSCVRLVQGDMAQATIFNDNPAEQALIFERQGFEYLHLVDLDGAFAGKPVNADAVKAILDVVSIPVQLGGGIRDLRTIERWLEKGVERVIIGTAAVRDPDLAQMSAIDLACRFEDAGVAAIVYTDISRDGVMKGLNIDATLALAEATSVAVIASGGLASLADVARLLEPDCARLAGAITGRALYDGRLGAAEALALIKNRAHA